LLETQGLAAKMLESVNAHLARKGQSLRAGTIVDATLIHAPSSTKNADKARDPEMHQAKKGKPWYFGMKAYISVDEFSGLVHHVKCTAANVSDVTVAIVDERHGRWPQPSVMFISGSRCSTSDCSSLPAAYFGLCNRHAIVRRYFMG
jgi:IS5 family transposase